MAYPNAGRTDDAFAEFHRGLAIEPGELRLRGMLFIAAIGERDEARIQEWMKLTDERDFNVTMLQWREDPATGLAEMRCMADRQGAWPNPLSASIFANGAAYYGDPEPRFACSEVAPTW